MAPIFWILWGAFWNRARGSQLYGFCHSTAEGRIISMLMLSLVVAAYAVLAHFSSNDMLILFVWCFSSLMLWCSFAWEKYTSSAMGVNIDMSKKAFAPIDWIMKKIWPSPKPGAQLRLWGMIATAFRMLLAAPCMIGLAYWSGSGQYAWAFAPAAMALPYYIFGYAFPNDDRVTMYSELTAGALLNSAILGSIGG